MTPREPSTLTGHNTKFELKGYSGYELTTTGTSPRATPLIVLHRAANSDSEYFIRRVNDQASLGAVELTFLTPGGANGPTVSERVILTNTRVNAVATGWSDEVIALRYSSLREEYPSGGGTATSQVAVSSESVAPDFSAAMTPDCGQCTGAFHGDQDGQSTITNYTTWNESLRWAVVVTSRTPSGVDMKVQVKLARDPSANNLLRLISMSSGLPGELTRFDLHFLRFGQQLMVPKRVDCNRAQLEAIKRASDGSLELSASVRQCDWRLQRYGANDNPIGGMINFSL